MDFFNRSRLYELQLGPVPIPEAKRPPAEIKSNKNPNQKINNNVKKKKKTTTKR